MSIKCDECSNVITSGHARVCSQYQGPRPTCRACGHSRKPGAHPEWCSGATAKDPVMPKCGCINHLGRPKTRYWTRGAADAESRRRWAGYAKPYKCRSGIWHLTTRGRIRVKGSKR